EHAPSSLDSLSLLIGSIVVRDTEDFDRPLPLRNQSDDGSKQHRLACAGSANDSEDLPTKYLKRQFVEDGYVVKPHDEVTHLDHDVPAAVHRLLSDKREEDGKNAIKDNDEKYGLYDRSRCLKSQGLGAALDLQTLGAGDHANDERH